MTGGSFQFRIFDLCRDEDGDVGIGAFPERKRSAGLCIPFVFAEKFIYRYIRARKQLPRSQKFFEHRGVAVNCRRVCWCAFSSAAPTLYRATPHNPELPIRIFFKVWKDADPDIPMFVAAKSEYAKLQ